MKKINIETISDGDKSSIRTNNRKHRVFLHSDLTLSFDDHKKAKIFLVGVSDFLTFKLFELNEIYIELFTHYRRAWFYIDNTQDKNILTETRTIDHSFKLCFERSNWQNGSHYVFNWIRSICESFQSIIRIIESMQIKRGNYAENRIMKALSKRIEYILNEIFSYGQPNKTYQANGI